MSDETRRLVAKACESARKEGVAAARGHAHMLNFARIDLEKYIDALEAKAALLDAPEIFDFVKAVQLEAAHQRARWPPENDAGKSDADWFWLIGYLAGKALHNPDEIRPAYNHTRGDSPRTPCPECRGAIEKQIHRIVTVAAAAANWHAAKLGLTNMQPGIDTPPEGDS